MSDLQFVTPLGTLDITEVYVDYDGPKVFACSSVSGELYLGVWATEEEMADHWILAPMSLRRLSGVRTGQFSVRQAILHAENGWVWRVRTPYDDSEGFARVLFTSQLNTDELPNDSARLNLPDNRLPAVTQDIITQAKQAQREVVLLALDQGLHAHEIAADVLGSVLLNAQALNRYLALRTASERGRLPKAVEMENTLVVRELFAASFGVRLESRAPISTLGESPAAPALERLMELLEAGKNHEHLQELLSTVGARAAARYRGLLKALADGECALRVQWGSPGEKKKEAFLKLSTIKNTLKFLREISAKLTDQLKIDGTLVGLITDRNQFVFVGSDGERYGGEITDALRYSGLRLPVMGGLPGTAVLEETIDINAATGAEKSTFVLIDMITHDEDTDGKKDS